MIHSRPCRKIIFLIEQQNRLNV